MKRANIIHFLTLWCIVLFASCMPPEPVYPSIQCKSSVEWCAQNVINNTMVIDYWTFNPNTERDSINLFSGILRTPYIIFYESFDSHNDRLHVSFLIDGFSDTIHFIRRKLDAPNYIITNGCNTLIENIETLWHTSIYNLDDTTFYSLPLSHPYTANLPFSSIHWYYYPETDTNYTVCLLSINQALCSVMQKDYSMLEKFPEFYER